MSFEFLDRVAASRPHPYPRFLAFRSKLVMNGDARREFFNGTDKVLLAYDADSHRLAIKAMPSDVIEHEGWQAFHIEPELRAGDMYQIDWRHFWDREVGWAGGRPIVCGEECLHRAGDDTLVLTLH